MVASTRIAPGRGAVPTWQLWAVGSICLVSAVLAALCDASPTASPVADAVWLALLGAAIPLAASRARRWTLVVLTGVSVLASADGPALVVAGASLLGAGAMVVRDQRNRVVAALVGATATQVLVRLPDLGFHGASALAAAGAVAPVLVSGLRNTRRRWRRPIILGAAVLAGVSVLLGAAVVGAAFLNRTTVDRGVLAARAGLDAASAGDGDLAAAEFDAAAEDLGRASGLLDSSLLGLARAIPVVGQHQRALATGSTAARELALTASEALDAVELDGLRPVDGRIDVAAFAGAKEPLERSLRSLEKIDHELGDASNPWLTPPLAAPLDEIRAEVASTLPGARTAVAGAEVLPSLVGEDGPRTWLVLFTTPAESRLLGGFVGSWATIGADHGELTLLDTGPSREVNLAAGASTRHIDAPAEFVESYSRYAPDDFFQNVSASPHFPSSAEVAASFFEQSTGVEVDGVIVVDPIALGSIADLVGGIDSLPHVGGPFDGDALAHLLLVDLYELDDATGEEVLDAAVQTTFDRLTSMDLPGPGVLADVLGPRVDEGRLLVWSQDPKEEALLSQVGLTGGLPEADGRDMLLVGVANNSPNKIDVYLDRDIRYDVVYDPRDGSTSATATATLTNTATLDLPDEVVENAEGAPRGTAVTYVTIFSPLDLLGLTVDGQEVPVAAHSEHGYRSYATLVEVPARGSVTLSWKLAGTLEPGGYELRHQVQPLVRPPTFEHSLEVLDP